MGLQVWGKVLQYVPLFAWGVQVRGYNPVPAPHLRSVVLAVTCVPVGYPTPSRALLKEWFGARR